LGTIVAWFVRLPYLRILTSVAASNFSFSLLPISSKDGIARQQVLISHEPEPPWHLHCVTMLFSITYFLIILILIFCFEINQIKSTTETYFSASFQVVQIDQH